MDKDNIDLVIFRLGYYVVKGEKMGWFSDKNKAQGSGRIDARDLAHRFQARSDWSGMTPAEFRIALEWAIKQQVYPQASEEQWQQIRPMYKDQIDYAMYVMCCTQFPFIDKHEWSIEESNENFANMTMGGNAKRNFFVGYINVYFYRYIHSIELQNLKTILAINEDVPIDFAVDYFLTMIIFKEIVDANPDQQFEYHQINGIPASRVQALEDLRNKIVIAYNSGDEVDLFKHIFYAMTFFAGSTYRGVHKALMSLLGFDDLSVVREVFYNNVASIIENKGAIKLGGITD